MIMLDDIRLGERVMLGAHCFEADEIRRFAAAFDPQPFHLDEEAAKRSHFGGLCASGWHTAAVCMRLIVEYRRREAEALQASGREVGEGGVSPGVENIRWTRPVYAGDTITFSLTPTAVRPSRSRPGWGLLSALVEGHDVAGRLVYAVESRSFGRMRMAGPGKTPIAGTEG